MKIVVFSAKSYDRHSLEKYHASFGHDLTFLEPRLAPDTVALARGFPGVCIFVNDTCDAAVIEDLARHGTKIIATRSAGFNQIDLAAAARHGILVARVPAYSPNAVSEFTLALILTLGRKTHKAYNRSREFNFEIAGLEGFELRDKTVGVFGTGKIGQMVIQNLSGFGCRILAYDKFPNEAVKQWATYVDGPTFARESDIITLHCPLTPETHHFLNEQTLPYLKDGVFIVNTSRGALLDTDKVIKFLKSGKIGYAGHRRLRGRSRLFLPRSVRQGADQRRTGAAVDLPQRDRHLAHGVSHRPCPAQHRRNHLGQLRRV
ncbi:MAG: NAD(P)-dependent oxidoreductase [Candidatus Competibacteraceae bacterium]|nr:NAD(P)-dependent oxidoreductase [Candidatus Competibacteraceae bacterium]